MSGKGMTVAEVHVVPITAVYEEGPDGFDLVTLHSYAEREH